jgi:hypothetical protein
MSRRPLEIYRSPTPADDAPIACSADSAGVAAQLEGFRTALGHLVATEREGGSVRFTLAAAPGLADALGDLCRREHACCSFLGFGVEARGDVLVLEITARPGAEAQLDEIARWPVTLAG